METGLAGKGVLVTGASGGIGAACVAAFRAEGARVAAHYHRGRERAEATGAEVIIGGDLREADDVERVFDGARDGLGVIDVCIAVAGVWPSDDIPVWELSAARWEETLRANLTTTFLTARAFLADVAANGHGSLVMISSTAGLVGEAGHADYAAAKSAITYGLMLSLKNEVVRVAPRARVNVVAPGWTESPMTRGLIDPKRVREISRTMALRKVAQPDDIAHQVVVLSSDVVSGHVTGQVVVVAGGMEGRVVHDDD